MEHESCRYRELFDAVDDIIYIRDFSGVILDINAAGIRFFGRPKDEIVGVALHRRGDDHQLQSLEATNRALREHGFDRSTVRLMNASQQERVLETTTTLIFDDQGRAAGAYGVMRDVTSQTELSDSLVVANSQLQDFARFLRLEKEKTERALLEAESARAEAERQRREADRQREIAQNAMKIIEADNARKTVELHEARELQLSLLPSRLPAHDEYEIAATMRSATEVGGDYYDCHESKDGVVTLALADATGHGLRAGMLVATAKSYFQTLAATQQPAELLRTMSAGFRNMNLRSIFICFTLLRLDGRTLRYINAGMPPALLLRSDGSIERLSAGGLPIGIYVDARYEEATSTLEAGDTLLLTSDGLSELFSAEGEELGIERIEDALRQAPRQTAQDVVDALVRCAEEWSAGGELSDDVTIIAVRGR